MTRGGGPGRTTADVRVVDGVALATNLIRLEIALWERVDTRLRSAHGLPLAFFESLHFLAAAPRGSMRVGDLGRALRVTIGGASKLVDRIERAGLIARQPDPGDRRASRLVLTAAGKLKLTAAVNTYEAEVGAILDGVLRPAEQQRMGDYVDRLLNWIDDGQGA